MEAQIACLGGRIGAKGRFLARLKNDKREHVIKLNLARRHLDPHRWGQAFEMLAKERGLDSRLKSKGGRPAENAATVAALAQEAGGYDTAQG